MLRNTTKNSEAPLYESNQRVSNEIISKHLKV